MTQTQLALEEPCRVPKKDKQHYKLLVAFQRGETLTVAEALSQYGVYALSQRCGELRRMGWPIISETVRTAGGARVSRYRLQR